MTCRRLNVHNNVVPASLLEIKLFCGVEIEIFAFSDSGFTFFFSRNLLLKMGGAREVHILLPTASITKHKPSMTSFHKLSVVMQLGSLSSRELASNFSRFGNREVYCKMMALPSRLQGESEALNTHQKETESRGSTLNRRLTKS